MFRSYSIFDHLYLIINDLFAIAFHYYSMTSIYIPNFSFIFYITVFALYNSDLYSIFSYLYLIVIHFNSIFLIYILKFHVSKMLYLHSIIYICFQSLFITIL